MKAKEYLNQFILARNKIAIYQREIDELRDRAVSTTVTSDGIAVQSSGSQSPMADAIVKIIDKQNQLEAKQAELIKLNLNIVSTINAINDEDDERGSCRELLHRKYIEGQTWEVISYEMHFTYGYVTYKLHSKALSLVQKILDSYKE